MQAIAVRFHAAQARPVAGASSRGFIRALPQPAMRRDRCRPPLKPITDTIP